MRRNWWWLSLALAIVAIDQLSKATYSSYTLNNFGGFSLHIPNLTAGALAAALLVTLTVVTAYGHSLKINKLLVIGLALELGGGSSNLLDRWYFGGVRDVFILPLTSFNLADVSIGVGALLVISGLITINRASMTKTDYNTSNETIGA